MMTKMKSSSNSRRKKGGPPPMDRWPGVTIPIDDMSGKYWFDPEAADTATEFFPHFLRHYQGEFAGQPFELDDWQRDLVIRPIFGWKRTADNYRRFRTIYVEVPKKNGKSHLCAGIGLYLLFCDGEPGAEIYSAAADREQAGIVFGTAGHMIEASPKLKQRCETFRRSITVPSSSSSYKVLSADVKTKHGPNIHGLLFDELHTQPSRYLWDTLTAGIAARRQPLIVAITTAGYDRNSICWEQHDYALKVMAGIIPDESFLPVVFQTEPDAAWTDPEVWRKVNPGIGNSVKMNYLETECNKAIVTPAKQNVFKRLHLNIWTEQETRWLDMDLWDNNATPINLDELAGRPCFGGLDLASTGDIAAFAKLFPPLSDEEDWRLIMRFWLPEEKARERHERDRVPYPTWVEQELIEVTEGNIIDYDVIRHEINEDRKRYNIREIAFDRWNATQLTTQLGGDGFTMVPIAQTFSGMAAATKEFASILEARKMAHGGNAVLRWMASNTAVKQDPGGNLKPDKGKSSEKIDGIVAAIMALARAMVVNVAPTESVYKTRDIRTI
jgi:phage terminase large subunit-like protein